MSTTNGEAERKADRLLNSLRQNRFKLEQYLLTMQSQQQALLESLQKITEEQITLQNTITGSLSQFEEKAGASQGLQGLFYGNPLLKNEIMQKRVALEQNVQKIKEMCGQLQLKLQHMGKTVNDIGRYIPPEILQEEGYVEELKEFLEKHAEQKLYLS